MRIALLAERTDVNLNSKFSPAQVKIVRLRFQDTSAPGYQCSSAGNFVHLSIIVKPMHCNLLKD